MGSKYGTINLGVVSPLLGLSGLFFPPFYVSTEEEVEVTVDSHDLVGEDGWM